jgi:cytidylate kinase
MALSSAQVNLHQLMGSLRTAEETPGGRVTHEARSVWPYVTISRQAGSGGIQFGRLLAERLNRKSSAHPWNCLDRELVQRIAADHHLSTDLIESLERSSHTWIAEFLQGLSRAEQASDLAVFRRVVETVRALARAGHVILVGLAAELITRDMPGGVRVRIIAPLAWRVKNLARNDHLTESEARDKVHLLDRDRAAFVKHFWPHLHEHEHEEMFHLTLNAGLLNEEQMAEAVLPLVRTMAPAG